ncbi:MAG: hypothetical protein A2V88_15065 [Elusimicrobia bacterium RBG_16_66_12]|nr:MAG: hypothetical protein A2V88_15065 [Elusimicrobia bacterium RBG_16_66_12]
MEELFRGGGAMGVAKERLVGTLLQTVRATVLLIRPPDRRIFEGGQLVIDDGTVTNRRPQNPISPADESVKQPMELVTLYNAWLWTL